MLMYWKCQARLQDILLIYILVLWVLGRLGLKLIQFYIFEGWRFFISFYMCCNTNSYFWKGGRKSSPFVSAFSQECEYTRS